MPVFYRHFSNEPPNLDEDFSLESGIYFNISQDNIEIEIPIPCTDSLYFKKQNNGIEICNDIRLLIETDEELNSAGIISCLLLGAPVSNLTPYKNIHACMTGYKYTISFEDLTINSEVNSHWSRTNSEDHILGSEKQIKIISDQIDHCMHLYCPTKDPVIFFSGGVDSSVLASRASEMGWTDTTLVHFSFEKNDPDTDAARQISSILNLQIDIIDSDKTDGFLCLSKAAEISRQIFCDISTAPAYVIVEELISRFDKSRTILDGTGADGGFGAFYAARYWPLIYRIPNFVLKRIANLYDFLDLWKKPSRLESALRIIRRSSYLPMTASIIAMNPLLNLTYYSSQDDLIKVSKAFDNWINTVSNKGDSSEVIPLAKIAYMGARNWIEKNKSPLNYNSYRIEYPFLNPKIVDLALQHARFWPNSDQPKRVLKAMLAKSIPSKLIYRKKQGFLGSLTDRFSNHIFLDHFEAVLNPNSILYNYINKNILVQLLDYLTSKRQLPMQTYNSLWSITFTNTWLSQVKEISKDMKQKHLLLN